MAYDDKGSYDRASAPLTASQRAGVDGAGAKVGKSDLVFASNGKQNDEG
jgi:hypothetical protein